jgi:hypothetical protein
MPPMLANTLAVVAKQNTFTLYINQQAIGSQQADTHNPYTQGMTGRPSTCGPTNEHSYGGRVWLCSGVAVEHWKA